MVMRADFSDETYLRAEEDNQKFDKAVKLIDDHAAQLNPYERELFFQRLDRRLDKLALKSSRTVVDGGCVVLQPRRWQKPTSKSKPRKTKAVAAAPRELTPEDWHAMLV
jgi:hypothetical protein